MFNNPTVQEFKDFFIRDFPYGTDPATSVLDQDIVRAFNTTNINFNSDFFADQAGYTLGYSLLSAHFLVMNLRMSSQGLNGQFGWLQQNKNVGSVSEGFAIPQRILDNPEFAMLTKTNYGAEFLMLILPQLSGQVFAVAGTTQGDQSGSW